MIPEPDKKDPILNKKNVTPVTPKLALCLTTLFMKDLQNLNA